MKGTALWLLTLAINLLLGQTFAQYGTATNYGNYSLTELNTYYLKTRPGKLEVSPNYLTVIEFESLITNVATGRADILNIEVMDDTLLIKPTRTNGQTDLIVFSEGHTLLFEVAVNDKNVPRRYVVNSKTNSTLGTTNPLTRDSTRLPNASSITQGSHTTKTPITSTSPVSPSISPLPTTTPNNTPYTGTTLSTVTDLPYPLAPTWLRKNMTMIRNGDELAINYAISNDGSNQLTIDPKQLRLITNGNQLSYTQTSLTNPINAISSNLPAGKTEHGVILIMGVPKDTNVVLQWPITELGTQNTWLVQENFN